MLTIHSHQMLVFERSARLQFETEMLGHAKARAPQLCTVLGDDRIRAALGSLLEHANDHGFTKRGPLQLYVEVAFLLGSGFDTDPQYGQLADLLRLPVDQMQRAEELHQFSVGYLGRVCGPGNAYLQRALAELTIFARNPPAFRTDFVVGMLDELIGIFPEKAIFLGEARLERLTEEAITLAPSLALREPRQQARLAALMFMFGHGCASDPLRPWVARMLSDRPAGAATDAANPAWIDDALDRQQPFPA